MLEHVEKQKSQDCESWLEDSWDKLDKSMYKWAVLFFRKKKKRIALTLPPLELLSFGVNTHFCLKSISLVTRDVLCDQGG